MGYYGGYFTSGNMANRASEQQSRREGNPMTDKQKTCQVCRLRPADKQARTSKGAPQWRCQTCHDLKNRAGFAKGKQ